MKLNYRDILAIANAKYGIRSLRRQKRDPRYVAPEDIPRIESEQVKCMLEALVEAINNSSPTRP
jgi:hypothetical protein